MVFAGLPCASTALLKAGSKALPPFPDPDRSKCCANLALTMPFCAMQTDEAQAEQLVGELLGQNWRLELDAGLGGNLRPTELILVAGTRYVRYCGPGKAEGGALWAQVMAAIWRDGTRSICASTNSLLLAALQLCHRLHAQCTGEYWGHRGSSSCRGAYTCGGGSGLEH